MDCLHRDLVWQVAVDEDERQFRSLGCTIAVIEEEQSMTQLVHPVLKVRIGKHTSGEISTL